MIRSIAQSVVVLLTLSGCATQSTQWSNVSVAQTDPLGLSKEVIGLVSELMSEANFPSDEKSAQHRALYTSLRVTPQPNSRTQIALDTPDHLYRSMDWSISNLKAIAVRETPPGGGTLHTFRSTGDLLVEHKPSGQKYRFVTTEPLVYHDGDFSSPTNGAFLIAGITGHMYVTIDDGKITPKVDASGEGRF